MAAWRPVPRLSRAETEWSVIPIMWPHPGLLRRALIVGWLCALALFPLVGIPSAGAAPRKPQAPLWGISAGQYGRTTLPGSHFTYALRPGMVIKDGLILHNFDSRPVRLSVYPADLRNLAGGGLAPAQAYEPRRGAGAWIHLNPMIMTVPPHRREQVLFTVSVPHGAIPGDYYGAVVAAAVGDHRKAGVHIAMRAALIVHFSVPGRIRVGARIGGLRTQATGGGETFNLVVSNTGNVTFMVSGAILLRDGSGRLTNVLHLGTAGLYVIPGGSAPLKAVWPRVPLIGQVRARAAIQVSLNGRVYRTYTTAAVTLAFFPWKPMIAGIAALVGCLVIGWNRRHWLARRYREWREDRGLLAEIRAQRRAEQSGSYGRQP
ncbi:MAG TPA: hypothetical protein VNL35_03990 [Chloroflexota bacterium]|nr:hypothetical protein [Chloroflexota bacterium]